MFALDPRILHNTVYLSTSFHPREQSSLFEYAKRRVKREQYIGVSYVYRGIGTVNATTVACRVERNTYWFTDTVPKRPHIVRAESHVFSRIDVPLNIRTDLEDHLLHIAKKEDGEWFRHLESHETKAWTLSFDAPRTEYAFQGDIDLITPHKDSIFNN